MSLLQLADLVGVAVFAYSGGLAAARQRMDLFGYIVLALLPAVGGGTLRDLMLGVPVFWVQTPVYVLVAIGAGLFAFAVPVVVGKRLTVLTWADALGMALFSVMGASKALAVTASPVVAVTMGGITAVVGGMLRDIVSNEIPLVLLREIYASAAVAGAAVFCVAHGLAGIPSIWAMLAGGTMAFAMRAAGIIFNLSLPIRRLAQPGDE